MAEVKDSEPSIFRWRRYKTAEGFFAVGVAKSPIGWYLQVGKWCFTTEIADDH